MSSKIDITAVYTRENKPRFYLRRERYAKTFVWPVSFEWNAKVNKLRLRLIVNNNGNLRRDCREADPARGK